MFTKVSSIIYSISVVNTTKIIKYKKLDIFVIHIYVKFEKENAPQRNDMLSLALSSENNRFINVAMTVFKRKLR